MQHTHTKWGGMIDCQGCHPTQFTLKKVASVIGGIIVAFMLIDLIILIGALAQIGIEDRTGYWSPFWLAQAKAVMWILQ